MPQDIDLLQGSWTITSLAIEGQAVPDNLFFNASIVVKGNRFTSIGMGAEYEGTRELDPSTNPRHPNMRFDVGPEKGNLNLCIYELTADI